MKHIPSNAIEISTQKRMTPMGAEYQNYWPRFLVDVLIQIDGQKDITGTVEVCAECHGKQNERTELEGLTISMVYAKALKLAIENQWLNEPQ